MIDRSRDQVVSLDEGVKQRLKGMLLDVAFKVYLSHDVSIYIPTVKHLGGILLEIALCFILEPVYATSTATSVQSKMSSIFLKC